MIGLLKRRMLNLVSVPLPIAVVLTAGVGLIAQTNLKETASGQVTFAKDVAPILQRSCQNCHRPDSIGPMALLTYDDARPWARSIKQHVVQRDMPPWYIDKNVGLHDFKNDISLTDQEIAVISKWVDEGAPKGNAADMPAPRKFEDNDRWHIGTPDVIVHLAKDVVVKSQSPDQWLDFVVDSGLTEDRYIQAVETKPIKGFNVVHHAVTSMIEGGDGIDNVDGGTLKGPFLNEYAVGKNGDVFPEGSGRLIKAGTKINFNLHLHAVGQDVPTNVALAIKLYPKGYVPKHVQVTTGVGNTDELDIPPNDPNARADGYTMLTKPTLLLSFQPHMHLTGKAACLEAIYPGGAKVETFSCVSQYRFGWHITYMYSDDVRPILPAGTMLHVITWHDNSASNKADPDPDNWKGWGERTVDDMSFVWVNYYSLSDEEFKQMSEERKASKKAKSLSSSLQPSVKQ
jgi:hypothetical protein